MDAPPPPATTPEALAGFREAGRIAREARELAVSMVRPGVRLEEVMVAVEDFIRGQGAGLAFPAQTSVNHVAAHYCPRPGDPTAYREGDVVKVDIGVHVDGWVADNAQTVYLGDDPRLKRLVDASAAGLAAALRTAGPGVALREVSAAIQEAITSYGFRPVTNLTGHGVARWTVHCKPSVPAVPDPRQHDVLRPGMVVAIEPFATTGRGPVTEIGRAEVFMLTRPPRKPKGLDPEVMETILGLHGLPFSRRDLRRHPTQAVEATLARLMRTGCLMDFPPLCDSDPSVRIAQTEHTLVVTEDGIEITTGEVPEVAAP